ncbi:caspase family protein [Streptomyces sp. NPDC048556]|uniref:caspase family protein n=1 Tax=Streptomyces sp. NPDC048556 TaxID=3156664 RepID=UPI0034266FAA
MIQHKALLIGASDYDDPVITPLPFVPGDLQRMRTALLGRGFSAVEIAASKRGVTPNFVNGRVADFLWRAQPGDALLVMLSGHGLHFEGADYLVPEDAHFRTSSIDKSCIKIDWVQELEESPAGQIIFLIDACREGIDRAAMAPPPGVRQWSNRKVAASLRRKVAYVYACSPAQVALFVRDSDVRSSTEGTAVTGQSFSIFSRAVSDLVSDDELSNLEQFEVAVQERIDATHRVFGKGGSSQKVRIVTDAQKSSFFIFPGPMGAPSHSIQGQKPAAEKELRVSLGGAVPVQSASPLPSGQTLRATPPSPPSRQVGGVSPSSRASRQARKHTATPRAPHMGLTPPADSWPDLRSPAHRTEREVLKLALQKPELVPEFDGYAEAEFTAAPYAAVYRCILAVGGVGSRQVDYLARIRKAAPNEKVRELLFELAVEPMHGKKIGRDYAGMQLAQVRIRSVGRRVEHLQSSLAKVERESGEPSSELMTEIWTLQQYLQALRQKGADAL